jgi:hypothetical protein
MYRLKNTKQHVIAKFEKYDVSPIEEPAVSMMEEHLDDSYRKSNEPSVVEKGKVKNGINIRKQSKSKNESIDEKNYTEPIIINKYYGDVHIDNRNVEYRRDFPSSLYKDNDEFDKKLSVEKKDNIEIPNDVYESIPNEYEYENVEERETNAEEEEEEYMNTTYEYDGEKYILENEKFLQKRFDDIDPTKSYTINMCMYKCIRNGCMPYLLYLMVYDENTKSYMIPKFALGSQTNDLINEDIIEENIMENVKQHLFELYPPDSNSSLAQMNEYDESKMIFDEDLFKGFFLYENEITMVYDTTNVNTSLSSAKQYIWVSPYEIFVSKQVSTIPISESVIATFKKIAGSPINVDFYHLKKLSDNTVVKTPYILFMCKPKNNEISSGGLSMYNMFSTSIEGESIYENVSNDIESVSHMQIIFPKILHPDLGNYTMFSSKPISQTSYHFTRFAVFVDIDGLNPLYLSSKETEKIHHLYDMPTIEQYSSITFKQNDIQLWCIKSPLYFSEIEEYTYNLNLDNKISESGEPKIMPLQHESELSQEQPVPSPQEQPVPSPQEQPVPSPQEQLLPHVKEEPPKKIE